MIGVAASVFGMALLAMLFFRRLRQASFNRSRSLWIATFAVVQCATALSAFAPPVFVLGLLAFAISASAIDFARQHDVRSLIVLGGSLAGIQVISPLGGLVVAATIPPLVSLRGRLAFRSQRAGLLALLLFAPASSAVLLAYATRNLHLDTALLLPNGAISAHRSILAIADVRLKGILAVLAFAGIALPVWYGALRISTRLLRVIGLVLSAMLAALFLSALFGYSFVAAEFIPALASISIISLGAWPLDRVRTATPVILAAISAVLSWLAAMVLP